MTRLISDSSGDSFFDPDAQAVSCQASKNPAKGTPSADSSMSYAGSGSARLGVFPVGRRLQSA